ncbi:uncharacterized protein LOC131604654 [Vicia villosa]|uniref:uncharacterized protein LOC131604654 n=1 Tax=Vicia villosa TaxID=3911 RepID=UPI00273B63F1|nr:uncharacterized protein LOC131604654 [Vicia villosa]
MDLQKAYDILERQALEDIMKEMSFPNRFIKWTMICIISVSYKYTINGHHRGLRQGGPISPLLFVLVMEYMHKCDDRFVALVMEAFHNFSASIELRENPTKCKFYTVGLDDNGKQGMLQITGYQSGELPFKYLGVPLSSKEWNKATIGKLLWNLQSKANKLWVKWVSTYYLKDENVMDWQSNTTASWLLKTLVSSRDDVSQLRYWQEIIQTGKYKTAKMGTGPIWEIFCFGSSMIGIRKLGMKIANGL